LTIWRVDPEVDPRSLGVDVSTLDKMADLFERGIERGDLCHGAQMALYRSGRRVFDVGGGQARPRLHVPVEPGTMFVIYSATKGLAALAMLMLYERGRFHYDEPVVKYWPDFARVVPEKQRVTIRHVMSHRAGLPLGPESLTPRWWGDRDAIRSAMEELPLAFGPGERNAYHPMNFGHLLNELVQRIDGRDCGQFLREEVFEPLGLADIHVGLPDDPALEERVAWSSQLALGMPGSATGVTSGTSVQGAVAAEPVVPERYRDTPEYAFPLNRPELHRAVLPASGGVASARDLAAFYALLSLHGALGDQPLVRRESLEHAATPTNRPSDVDGTIGLPIRWGTGWHLGAMGRGSSLRSFGHGGAGGQLGFADREHRMALGFVTTGERHPDYLAWRMELQDLAFAACPA